MANPAQAQETKGNCVSSERGHSPVVGYPGCHWPLGGQGLSVTSLLTTAFHENAQICKLSCICFKFPGATPPNLHTQIRPLTQRQQMGWREGCCLRGAEGRK